MRNERWKMTEKSGGPLFFFFFLFFFFLSLHFQETSEPFSGSTKMAISTGKKSGKVNSRREKTGKVTLPPRKESLLRPCLGGTTPNYYQFVCCSYCSSGRKANELCAFLDPLHILRSPRKLLQFDNLAFVYDEKQALIYLHRSDTFTTSQWKIKVAE